MTKKGLCIPALYRADVRHSLGSFPACPCHCGKVQDPGPWVPPHPATCSIRARANLTFVKAFRVFLLVVLAVLLPVRGAVAAAMLCPVAGSGMQNEVNVHSAAHQAMDHAMAHAPADAQHDDHASAGHGHHDHGQDQAGSDECNMCSAYCSITPLVSAVPQLPAPLDPPSVKFPGFASGAPTFLSDGQERPPRSI